ncbi:MAG: hypothetical protein QNI86_13010 [Halieaceae bacterium]|nr:hypothetical protein [Halieaceae bacterium]
MTYHKTTVELEAGLDHVRAAPSDVGELKLVVRRPANNEREVLAEAQLCTQQGLEGDNWSTRGSPRMKDGSSHPDMQLNIMNVRATALVAGPEERWPLAGDQLYVDMDLSEANMPAGTRLSIGDALIEVTDQPHLGCQKFRERFGEDALRFVNSDIGKQLHLRGINARVIEPGTIRPGDTVRKLA